MKRFEYGPTLTRVCCIAFLVCGLVFHQQVNGQDAKDDGADDLAAATQLKLNAKSLSDLDKVIDLCESAIKKGLPEESANLASELLEGVLLDYAKRVTDPIFRGVRPDPRWQFLRSQAMKKLDRLDKLENEWGETYILIAKLNALPNGDRERATAAASKAVKFAGEDKRLLSEALYIRGSLTQDEQARIADFNQAVKIDPTNEKALRQRAAYFLMTQQHEKAIEDFETLIDLTDGNSQAYQQLIESLLISGKADDALEVSNEALDAAGDNEKDRAAIYGLQGRIYFRQMAELEEELEKKKLSNMEKTELESDIEDLKKQAIKSLSNAIERNEKDILSLMLRVELSLGDDEYEQAKKDIDQILSVRPGLARGIFLRSIVAGAEKRFADAAKDLELLTKSDPQNLGYRLQLANMYHADDRHKQAIKIFKGILEEDNDNVFAIRGLADAQLGAGDHEEAIKNYERSLEIEADDDHVLNNLAWLLATSTKDSVRDGKRSIELGLKACELTDYKQAHILSTLAAGYAEAGDFENARKWSQKSVEISDGEQIEDLKKELESYKQNKPWREIQESKESDGSDSDKGDTDF